MPQDPPATTAIGSRNPSEALGLFNTLAGSTQAAPKWTTPGTMYVLSAAQGGSNSNSGLSWDKAKLTINAAVAALPTEGSGGTLRHEGTIFIGPGTFIEADTCELNENIRYVGVGSAQAAGASNTVVKIQAAGNATVFGPTAAFTDYSHGCQIEHMIVDGNNTNQTQLVSGTASSGGATTLVDTGSGWTVNAYAKHWVRTTGGTGPSQRRRIVSNTADTLTIAPAWRTNVANGTTYLIDGAYDCVELYQGGFNCYMFDVLVRNASRHGIYIRNSAVNVDLIGCTGGDCYAGFICFDIAQLTNGGALNIYSSQADSCGHGLVIDSDEDGTTPITVVGFKTEAFLAGEMDPAFQITNTGANGPRLSIMGSFSGEINGLANNVVIHNPNAIPITTLGTIGNSGYTYAYYGQDANHTIGATDIYWPFTNQQFMHDADGPALTNVFGYMKIQPNTGLLLVSAPDDSQAKYGFRTSGNPGTAKGEIGWDGAKVVFGGDTGDAVRIPDGVLDFNIQGIARIGGDAGASITFGTGTPEGAETAIIGSLFLRSDGGTGTSLYVKESGTGNTGWVGK